MATVISAVVIFLVLVLVHEFGHFITAKLCGVTVNEFAIGMGPTIFRKEHNGTLYSLRCIPIGGFCAMEGEDEESDSKGAFSNKNPWQRILILASGALMNLILGFILVCIINFPNDTVAVPVIENFIEDSPAYHAGMLEGDEIKKLNGDSVPTYRDLKFQLSRCKGKAVDVEFERDGKRYTVSVEPVYKDGEYLLGFEAKMVSLNLGTRIYYAYIDTVYYSKLILVSLFDLVTGEIGMENMSGPVGIVSGIGEAAKMGWRSLLLFAALITINLGLFNLLPFPALDGGRIFFVLVELIIRRKIPADKEGMVHFIGFALLILLMIFATWQDIVRLITK